MFLFLPSRQLYFQHESLSRNISPLALTPPVDTHSVATLVVARPDLSSVTPTGIECGKQKSFRLEARVLPGTTPVNRKTTRHDETSNAPPPKGRTCSVRLPATHSLLSKPGLVRKLPFRFSNKLKPSPRCTPPLRSRRLRSRDTTRVFFVAFEKEMRDLRGTSSGSFAKSSQDRRCDDGVFRVHR